MNVDLAAVSQVSGLAEGVIWGGFLVFLRVGGALALMPAFGDQSVPPRVRLGLALAFAAVVAPAVIGPAQQVPLGVLPMLAEMAIGLLLGFGLRLVIQALQMAAMMIAQATSLAQMFAGAAPEPQPAVGNLLTAAALALAVAAGLHIRVAQMLILSFDLLPPGQIPSVQDVARWGLARMGTATALAFSLAAPFVLAAFLYNLALGVMNRAMPQLAVAFIGAPALAFGGLALLALAAPTLLALWLQALNGQLAAPFFVPR